MASRPDVPKFNLGGSMYDQGTFQGRLYHFMNLVDPRSLFTSQSALEASVKLLDEYERGQLSDDVSDADLWAAQKTKQAIIHPDTGEKIIMPFRMSGYIPFGSPIVVGMLLPNPTLKATVMWQWLNQSHNAFFNYANRNATKPTPTSRFIAGYFGAVGSAVSIAVGLNVGLSKTTRFSPQLKSTLQRFIPYPAVACANVCNVLLMRNSELSSGIDVCDKDGHVIGASKVAAKQAISSTIVTRIILPAPILFLPPIIMTNLEKMSFMKRNPRMNLPINAVVVTLSFALALPTAIAMFPQQSKLARSALEPELQQKTKEEFVFFNKGL